LHTLKGSSRMAGAMAVGELTHHMETRVEDALSVKTLPAALFQDLETSWDRMGYLFERLQKPGGPEAAAPVPAIPAAVLTPEARAVRAGRSEAVAPKPAEAKPAAPKPVPPSERE